MTELHVKPKSGMPWWVWLLIALVVIGILYFLLRDNDREETRVENEAVGFRTNGAPAMVMTASAPAEAWTWTA